MAKPAPKSFSKIQRSSDQRHLPESRRRAKLLSLWRQFDRSRGIPDVERAYKPDLVPSKYDSAFHTDFRQQLKKQSEQTGKPVSILDVGCGKGSFLAHLKTKLGNRVITEGIALTHFKNPGVDRLTIGHIDALRLNRKFDKIVSLGGGTFYSFQPYQTTRKILGALTKNGEAYLDFGAGIDRNRLETLASQFHCQIEFLAESTSYTVVRFSKSTPKPIRS